MYRSLMVAFSIFFGTIGLVDTKEEVGTVRDSEYLQMALQTERLNRIVSPITNRRAEEKSLTKALMLTQFRNKKVPRYAKSVAFWESVARCETGIQKDGSYGEWNRGHDWGPNARSWVSGGLGLAHTTWRNYGGLKYAPKAAKATKTEQIVIATRVGFIGWQTSDEYLTLDDRLNNRPHFRNPAGFDKGWGGVCVKHYKNQWEKTHKKKG